MEVYRYGKGKDAPDEKSIRDEVDLSSTSFYYSNEGQKIPKARLVPYHNKYLVRFDISSLNASERGTALTVEISSQDLFCLLKQGLYQGLSADEVSSIINILTDYLVEGNNRLKKEKDKLQEEIDRFRDL